MYTDMLCTIIDADDRIRAIYMNGSRTNSNVPKDIFQDYDGVVYDYRSTHRRTTSISFFN